MDVNNGHLAVAVVAPDGNITGSPFTIPLELAGLPASRRDGRVRAAISTLIATARDNGHVRVTEMNEQVAANLDRMITELEAITADEQEDAAGAS